MNEFDRAKKALNDLFADMSVPPEETKTRLHELRDEIDIMLSTL